MLLLQSLLHSFEHRSLQKNEIHTLIETAFDVVEYIAGAALFVKCFIIWIHFSHEAPYFHCCVYTHIFIQNHFLINFFGAMDCTQGLICGKHALWLRAVSLTMLSK